MIYIPNTYNNDLVGIHFYDLNEFVRLQKKYRSALELYLDKLVHLREVEQSILESGIKVPKITDLEYNFYHQSEILKSGYLFVRNNIHIERLSQEDIKYLKESLVLDEQFIAKTLQTVIFEDGAYTFFGSPSPFTEVQCKSVVMEFAYERTDCESLDNYYDVKELIEKIQELLSNNFQNAQIPLSFLVYNRIPDYFLEDKKKVTK